MATKKKPRNAPTQVTLQEMTDSMKEYKERFKVGDHVVLLKGSGIWEDLFTLTGKIKEITNDSMWTFVIDLDKPDLLEDAYPFTDPKTGELHVCVHGSLIEKMKRIPKSDRPLLNKGKGPE